MFSRLAAAVTLLAVVAGALGQALTINTPPSVVVCQPAQLSWTGGTGPYFLSILPGNQPGAAALVDFGRQEGNSLTWTANLAAGTSIFLQVRDSNGAVGQSGTISIQSSSDTSCVGQSASTSAGSTSAGTGSTTTPAGTTTGTTAAATTSATGTGTTTTRATTGTTTGTSSAATTSATGNSAVKASSVGALAFAGVAAVAALL
ncbi:hypothetical protein FA13DRAFT_1919645 [Coprinellus micaceus]|uniref:Uncharacterized protein n=1 Tax=Coprinellus micaceus TaxID=71717 RepID=A0A4Y7TMF5_COPMI|nr:hypothetical protein FA13DRAFT_1919645 [Coprinellus micaceus]